MFKPMLAPGEDPISFPDYFKKLQYPLLCSPKLDGIRCIIRHGNALSRSGKLLPSEQVQSYFTGINDLDGELILGEPTDPMVYNKTQSYVMSHGKSGDLKFFIFDYTSAYFLDKPYYERLNEAATVLRKSPIPNVKILEHVPIENYEELIEYETNCLKLGFEGIMLRNPVGRYKNGRATFKEGLIYKLKRFSEDEGTILEIIPGMTNMNPLERSELGYAKRSTAKANLVESDLAGIFIVEYAEYGAIDVAPGAFTHEERKHILEYKEDYIGRKLKFRFFNHGIKDKPRFPRAVGFRDLIDLGE